MATKAAGPAPGKKQTAAWDDSAVDLEHFSGPAREYADEHGWTTYYSGSREGAANVNTSLGTMGCDELMQLWDDPELRGPFLALVTLGESARANGQGRVEVHVGYCPPGVTFMAGRDPSTGEPVYTDAVAGWYAYAYVDGRVCAELRGRESAAQVWNDALAAARQAVNPRKAEPVAAVVTAPAQSRSRWPFGRRGDAR